MVFETAPPSPGFWTGLWCAGRGAWSLVRMPRRWLTALVPVVLFAALWLAAVGVAYEFVADRIFANWAVTTGVLGGVQHAAMSTLSFFFAALAATLVAMGLAQPLSGPALDALVLDKERELGLKEYPSCGWFAGMGRSLQSLLVSLALGLPASVFLTLLGLLFPPLLVVTAPIQVLVATGVLTWDMCDLPLSMRGMTVVKRIELLRGNLRAVAGFGVGLWLLQAIPLLGFLVLPAGLLGSTELVHRLDAKSAPPFGSSS